MRAILPAIGIALIALLLAALAAGRETPPVKPSPQKAAPVAPGSVYRNGTYSVLLTDRPCADDDFRMELESEGIPPAQATVITSGSRRYSGCWAKNMDGDIVSRDYLSTESGTLPKEGFRREKAS